MNAGTLGIETTFTRARTLCVNLLMKKYKLFGQAFSLPPPPPRPATTPDRSRLSFTLNNACLLLSFANTHSHPDDDDLYHPGQSQSTGNRRRRRSAVTTSRTATATNSQ